jgi:hypothetical protein
VNDDQNSGPREPANRPEGFYQISEDEELKDSKKDDIPLPRGILQNGRYNDS